MTPLPARPEPRTRIDLLREQIAPEASDGELAYLDAVAHRYDLDPIAGQIVLIGRWDRRAGRKVHRPTITVEGRHVIAERTGELHGIDGPEWCGARNPDGTHTWLEVWDEDEPPHAARVFVHRTGRLPANGTVRWKEFAQRDGSGALMPTWQQMPSHMLGKTALSLGLRRAFAGLIPAELELDLTTEFGDASTGAELGREADAVAVVMITPAQRERMRQLMKARGYGGNTAGDRARRLALMRQAIDDDQLATPEDLTSTEASQVIDYLEGLRQPAASDQSSDAPAAAEPPEQDAPPDDDEAQQGLPL